MRAGGSISSPNGPPGTGPWFEGNTMADFEFKTYVAPPSNDFSLGKATKNKRKGTAKLKVNIPGAGEIAGQEQEREGREQACRVRGHRDAAREIEGRGAQEARPAGDGEGGGQGHLLARRWRPGKRANETQACEEVATVIAP